MSNRKVTDQLFPTGRAHKVQAVGERTRDAITDGINDLDNGINDLLNGVLPDNSGFTVEWCERHERMYALPSYNSDTLQDRIDRIIAHLTPPNPEYGYLSLEAIQNELNANGWNGILYVYENLTGLFPQQVLPQLSFPPQLGNGQLGDFQLGTFNFASDYPQFFTQYQLGDFQLGASQLGSAPQFNNKIANSVNRYDDLFVNLYPISNTFYICGPNLGDIVILPLSDEVKLRTLLLEIKPLNSVGFLLIEYI